jgi:hypothetical protein
MRTGLFLLAGFFFFSTALIMGWLVGDQVPAARTWSIVIAGVVWLCLTSFNMWLGVTKGGYSVREEAPILVLLFGLPLTLAVIVSRWIH